MGGSSGGGVKVNKISGSTIDPINEIRMMGEAGAKATDALNAESKKLDKSLKDYNDSLMPYGQSARDAVTEMSLMSGVKTAGETPAFGMDDLFGRIQGFDKLMQSAAHDGTVELSGQEITDRYRGTPGYGAAFNAGLQEMGASQAASMLPNPSRALGEAAAFGQGVMDLSIQSHLDRMQQIAGLTLPVVLQQYQSSLERAQAEHEASIAGPKMMHSVMIQQGDMGLNASKFNASQQMQASSANEKSNLDLFNAVANQSKDQKMGAVEAMPTDSYGYGAPVAQQYAPANPYSKGGSSYVANPYDKSSQQSAGFMTDSGPMAGLFGGLF